MIPSVYFWKEFDNIDHPGDFQLSEFRQNRDKGKSIYQNLRYVLVVDLDTYFKLNSDISR